MYLRRLSQPAKEVFIEIAKYLCNADGIVDKREEKLLAAYGEELQMSISPDLPKKSLEALAMDLNAATDRIQKRIVVFELMGLALVDGTYADEEKAFFKLLGEKLDLRPTFTERCEASIREYMAVQKKIDEVIFG